MSTQTTTETKKIRLASEILDDYRQTTTVLGDRCYRKKLLELEIETLYSKLYQLNQENEELKKTVEPPTLLTETQTA